VTKPFENRETARILLRKPSGDVFLLLTHFDPEVGLPPRWITPGGGIDAGESVLEAAVRELREETGILVSPEDLGNPIGVLSGKWIWSDGETWHTYRDTFFELIVEDFYLDDSQWTDDERRDVLEYRWWSLSELQNTEELIGPHGLIEFMMNR
jgi:8-oxo-dGTP pyrophosphatase MutT (NUDIX family)